MRFAKKRHRDCRCGTGDYCHHHQTYGIQASGKHFVPRSLGKVHLAPADDEAESTTFRLQRHGCGGGGRVLRKGTKGI
jgi:hypothetical protein